MTVTMNGALAVEVNNSAFPSGPIGLQYTGAAQNLDGSMACALSSL